MQAVCEQFCMIWSEATINIDQLRQSLQLLALYSFIMASYAQVKLHKLHDKIE